jgi:hypothetical protein
LVENFPSLFFTHLPILYVALHCSEKSYCMFVILLCYFMFSLR